VLILLLVETSRLSELKRRLSEETEVAEVATEVTEEKAKKADIAVEEAKEEVEKEEKAEKEETVEKEEKAKKAVVDVEDTAEVEVDTVVEKIEVKVKQANSDLEPKEGMLLEVVAEDPDLKLMEKMLPLIKLMLMKLRYINSVKNMLTGKERDNVSKEKDLNLIIPTTERVVLEEELDLLRMVTAEVTGEMLLKKEERRNILPPSSLKERSPRLLLKVRPSPRKLKKLRVTSKRLLLKKKPPEKRKKKKAN
jgi:hypothetical protein